MTNILMVNIARLDKRLKIAAIANRLGLSVKTVGPQDFAKPIGVLAGAAEDLPEGDGTPFSEEMLVLCSVDEGTFHEFLGQLRSQKVPVALKAVLTEHNAAWSVSALYRAISQERQAMMQGRKSPHHL